MSKETFKSFARLHPELASSVLSGTVSWQQLYEIYEIYGENNSVWNTYIHPSEKNGVVETLTSGATTIKDFVNTFKNMDMDSVQKGISNIQKAIGLLQDIGLTSKKEIPYEPRPIYQRFED